MGRWLRGVGSFLRGPARLVMPSALGALGMLLVTTAGTAPLKTTLAILLLAFFYFVAMRRWGSPLPAGRAWPRWLTAAGIGGMALVALGALLHTWMSVGEGITWLQMVFQDLAVLLMGGSTAWISWRQVELAQGSPRRGSQAEALGEAEVERARRALQTARGWVGAADLARLLNIPEARADQILEHLYIKGELQMEVQEGGEIRFRWEEAPRMGDPELSDEELERLLREE